MKNNNIRKEVIEKANNSLGNIKAFTNYLGISFGKDKRYYPLAKVAAQKGEIQKDKDIFWVPITIKKQKIACGLISKEMPQTEIELLKGLVHEIEYSNFLREQLNKKSDPQGEFIRDLLTSEKIKSFDEAIEKGDILGINLRVPQTVMIIELEGYFKQIHNKKGSEDTSLDVNKECAKISKTILEAFNNFEENFCTHLEDDKFVLLKWSRDKINTINSINFFKEKAKYIQKVIEKKIKSPRVLIGVGQYYPGISGLKKSYYDAEIALDIGKKIFKDKKVYHISDIGMLIAISPHVSLERKCEIAHQIIGGILEDRELLKTVKVFLEKNLNLTEAAKELHLHRNTLLYRLNKIKRITGLNPQKFKDAAQIKLGLMLISPKSGIC